MQHFASRYENSMGFGESSILLNIFFCKISCFFRLMLNSTLFTKWIKTTKIKDLEKISCFTVHAILRKRDWKQILGNLTVSVRVAWWLKCSLLNIFASFWRHSLQATQTKHWSQWTECHAHSNSVYGCFMVNTTSGY